MKKFYLLFVLLLILTSFNGFSQNLLNPNQEKITKAFTDYFALDRENIHLQLNKSIYLTNETIWFKGYVIEKKSQTPFAKTTNVYVSLVDHAGKTIETNLYLAENGTLNGSFKLLETLNTGAYSLQVYTNYMNNFEENESSVYKINIINPADNNYIDTKKINYNTVSINFFPESGIFLEGCANTIAVKIADCNDLPLEIKNAEVYDAKGILITNFSTNQFGFGRFEIPATRHEIYKVILEIKGDKIEKALPLPALKGITYSVNNYTLNNKTIIKVKTNERTLIDLKDDNHTLVIHNNDNVSFIDFSFKDKKLEQNMILLGDQFSDGINTISLIDKNLLKLGERNVFKNSLFKKELNLAIMKKSRDSIQILGKMNIPFSELSISVLPFESVCSNLEKNMTSSLNFAANFENNIPNIDYYLTNNNKGKQMELDNILITQKSKYNWATILSKTPQEKHTFDMGLTIRGTVNNTVYKKDEFKVKMSSLLAGVNEIAEINDKNEFYFKNFVATDSTVVHFSLLTKKDKLEKIKLYTRLEDNNKKFLKPFTVNPEKCSQIVINKSTTEGLFPKLQKSINLDSITIEANIKKAKLQNNLKFNNNMSKGYKITEDVNRQFRDVLDFIASHGFDVRISGGSVNILARVSTSFNGSKEPQVFVDDVPETNFNLLQNINLTTIDEIYINKRGYGGGMDSGNGVIRIYTKKGFEGKKSSTIVKSQSLMIQNGFEQNEKFTNPKYAGFNNDGFQQYGTIHWDPSVKTDEAGNFKFSIPNFYQKSVRINIEGISSEGILISETRILNLE